MQKHQIKLIDNTYSEEEAKELLLALINDKIKFLNQRIFSLKERFGADTYKLERRVAELKDERQQLLTQFEKIKGMDCSIEIDCHVHMKIHERERVVV